MTFRLYSLCAGAISRGPEKMSELAEPQETVSVRIKEERGTEFRAKCGLILPAVEADMTESEGSH